MRKVRLSITAATLALVATAGIAYAAPGMWSGDGEVTRVQAQQRAAEHFARIDANDDGVLDRADRTARRAQHFDRLDANGDGAISREEFTARHARAKRDDEVRIKRGKPRHHGMYGGGRGMMRTADADKDGAISQAEFAAGALRMFDAADANDDGTVTAAERRSLRETMRAQRQERRAARPAK